MQSILDGLTRLDSDIDAVNASLASEIATRDANDDAHDLKLNKLAAEYFFSGQPINDGATVSNGGDTYFISAMIPVPAGKVARIVEYGANFNITGTTLQVVADKGSMTPEVLVASSVLSAMPSYAGDIGQRVGAHYSDPSGHVFYDNSAGLSTYYPTLVLRIRNTTGGNIVAGEDYTAWARVQIT